jgi:hypothetical protein
VARTFRPVGPAGVPREGAFAAVNAGSVLGFTGTVSAQQKADVLNSVLLAQLTANARHDRHRDVMNWYEAYHATLLEVGWELSKFNFTKHNPGHPRFNLRSGTIDLMRGHATDAEIIVVHSAMGALDGLDDGARPVVIFESNAHDVAAGNFQIVSCGAGPGHRVIMTIAAFYYATSEPVRRVLGFDFSRDGTRMDQARNTVVLKENVYAKFREKVTQRLGARAFDFIADLQI